MNRPLLEQAWVSPVVLGVVVMGTMLPSEPWSQAIGHPTGDLSDHLQGMWWFGGEILQGRWPLWSQPTHFPDTPPLWFPDPIGALLALPFRALGPVVAFNAVLFLQLWLAGVAGWGMARDFGASAAGALLAGLFLCTSPFLLGLVHSGITESLGLAPVVLFTWALLRAMGREPTERPLPWWGFLWPGLALILVGLQSPVSLVGALLLAGACALGCAARLPHRLGTLAGLAAVAAAPMLLLRNTIVSTMGGDGVVHSGIAPGWMPVGLPATDLLGFVRPGAHYFPDTPALGNPGVLHVYYLGWVALGLAVLGWRRAPWLRLPAVLMGLACLGPSLCVDGQHIPSLEAPLLLPLSLLYVDGSPLSFVHHPYRLVALLLPLLALLLAHGAGRLQGRIIPLIGIAMVAEALILSPAPWPFSTTDGTASPVYASLPEGPVMDWPPDATDWNRRYLRWQTQHGRAIAYGVNTTFPEAARHDRVLWKTFVQLTHPGEQLNNRDIPGRPPLRSTQPAALVEQGFSALVLHGDALDTKDRERMLQSLVQAHGPPDASDGLTVGWALQP